MTTEARARAAIVAAALCLFFLQAWRSDGYVQSDEWFQTVELAAFKLGRTPASALPWEFGDRIRPFLQPAAYAALARALGAVGISSPAALVRADRLAGALASLSAALLLWAALARRLPDPRRRTLLLLACSTAFYLPLLGVRTSSEALSGALLAAAVAGYLLLEHRPGRAGLAAGLLLGLSFDARYQLAFCALGFAAWLAAIRRSAPALLGLVAGFSATAALGLVLDRWGYGAWTFTPWNYLRVNLLEGRAAGMGTAPVYHYLVAYLARRPPLPGLLVAAVLAFWWRAPRDLLTWVAVPFALGHCLLAHKEVRFLFPLGPLAAAMAGLLLLQPGLGGAWLERLRPRLRPLGWALLAANAAYLLAGLVLPLEHDLTAANAVRAAADADPRARFVVLGGDPFVDEDTGLRRAFLAPAGWAPATAASWSAVAELLDRDPRPLWAVARLDDGPPAALRDRRRVRLEAAALPEGAVRLIASPFVRRTLRGLWRIEP